MPSKSYILAIDQGTTGSTALLIDEEGQTVSKAYREIQQIYPQPGWVEQSPNELFQASLAVAQESIQKAGVSVSQVKGIGITGQRETTIVWDRHTGEPVSNAIVWQCRRTASMCEELKQQGLDQPIKEKTGLIIDAYFSATKLRWILDHIPQGQHRAQKGDLLFGTVDSWLIWNLTGSKAHVTDYTNACRTMLFNINTLQWDRELLATLEIPEAVLPQVMPSSKVYGETASGLLGDSQIPIGAIAGDQQAALFGQACYDPGMAKNTYGTGSFVLLNTGDSPVPSQKGLITTVAWGLNDRVSYALEGSIFITGAAVQWLRDGLRIITDAAESEAMACSVADNGGVYFVPAFVGLGAPYWDMYARGTVVGLTRGTTREHLVRATLEAIAYQTRDVVEAMEAEAGLRIPLLRVDGGGTANSFLMQFQADILGIPIQRTAVAETTALGAAYLAGLAVGMWRDTNEVTQRWHAADIYEPQMNTDRRETLFRNWKRAVERAHGWSLE
ncbi:MAG TPA: glycerol kinase GlpK [Dehalococcoidia bacterium]|nr:glycerol kinase GlpK [Dehalococcoidia bacterium]